MSAPRTDPPQDRAAALRRYDILDTAAEPGFDDIVTVASELCGAPVALITLLDRDRQWFKARLGFAPAQTPLSHAVCAHMAADEDALVIPDLTRDARTRDNPLVTGPEALRFYAGAPLLSEDGQVLGAVCVLDTVARPEGLSPARRAALQALARHAMAAMEARRGRAEAQARERHWRERFERLREGFVLGRVLRDEAGRPVDVLQLEVNAAWSALVGRPEAEIAGRSLRALLPAFDEACMATVGRAVDGDETAPFLLPSGADGRHHEVRAHRVGPDLFFLTSADVADRVRADRALRDSEARFRSVMATVPVGILVAEAPSGRIVMGNERLAEILGHTAFEGVGATDHAVFKAYHPDGRPVAAHEYPLARIVSGAVETAEIEVEYERPDGDRVWIAISGAPIRDGANGLRGAVVAVTDVTARRRAAAAQDILNHEVSHRLKNTLAMVQAIATQTLRAVPQREPIEAFEKRLLALGAAQDVLLRQSWSAAEVGAVVAAALRAFGQPERFDVAGPEPVTFGPRATLSLSLVVHELATNALKYGSLSVEAGRVELGWRVEGGVGGEEFVLVWRERNGPPPVPTGRKGFGSRLIGMGLVGTGGVSLRFDRAGFEAEMRAPLDQVKQS